MDNKSEKTINRLKYDEKDNNKNIIIMSSEDKNNNNKYKFMDKSKGFPEISVNPNKANILEGNINLDVGLEVDLKVKSVDKSTNKVVKGSGVTLPYANYKDMDEANKNAADVLASQGSDAAVDHMFTDQKTGRKLSYAEMRGMYG